MKITTLFIAIALACACQSRAEPQSVEVAAVGHTHAYVPTAPTAQQLSEPGALQRYIDDQAKRAGEIVLPPGRIEVPNLLLRRLDDVTIRGPGTTIAFTGPTDKPAIRQAQCVGLHLEGVTLEFGGDLLWSMENWRGYGTLRTTFDRVTFRQTGTKRTGRAMRFGRSQSELNCADVLISNCFFRDYDTCLHVVGNQALRIVVTDVTDVWHCNRVWQIDGGGHLQIDGKSGVIGAKEIARTGPNAIGSSLQPVLTLRDVYIDDVGSPTRLLDMSRTPQYWQRAVIENVKCNVADGAGEGFDLVVGPHESRFGEAKIVVKGLTKTGKANTTPVTPTPPAEEHTRELEGE